MARLLKDVLRVLLVLLIGALLTTLLAVNSTNEQLPKLQNYSSEPTTLPPSMLLLSGGARWAARNGVSALYIDWMSNWLAHGQSDGKDWGPWPPESEMENWTYQISYMLNQSGFSVQLAGDLPENLSGYDLVVIFAYWAVEPRHCSLVRDYVDNGGGLVVLAGVPEMFRCYCKDWWTYRCPTDNASLDMKEWLGCDGNYVNTGGYANVAVDNPFNTTLLTGDTLIEGAGGSNAAITNPHEGAQVVAEWEKGYAFAYTYEHGQGRVFYQAIPFFLG